MATKVLVLTLFCYCNLALANRPIQKTSKNIWRNIKPGELLRSLDIITSNAQHLTEPIQKQYLNINLTPAQSSNKPVLLRWRRSEPVESQEETSSYDYDKAYEEFVKKYFGDSLADILSDSESLEKTDTEHQDARSYSGEDDLSSEADDDEPVSEASEKQSKAEKCKKIARGQQNCLICKNHRTGENSESCSFNKEIKPQRYKYEKQKNYRKYQTSKSTDNEDSKEQNQSNPSLRRPMKSNDSSFCTMKKLKHKVCYYCDDKAGKRTKCYAE